MIKNLVFLGLTVSLFTSCKKDKTADPTASFSLSTAYLNNDTASSITIAVYESISLSNSSKNASSYSWNFGDGYNSNEKSATHSYTKAGTYTLTLTVSATNGKQSTTSKTIRVAEPIAKQISVTSLNLKSALGWASTYPTASKVNIWIEILKRAASGQEYPLSNYGVPLAPLAYKTAVVSNVDASMMPVSFNISNRIAIDISGLGSEEYIFNLYGQDNTGTYLISSSHGSGVSLSMSGDVRQNKFEVTTGFDGSNMKLSGDYE